MAATVEEVKSDLEKLGGDFNKSSAMLTELIQKQDEEMKKLGGTTTETSKGIRLLEEQLKTIGEEFKGVQVDWTEVQKKLNRSLPEKIEENKSIGQRFVESEAHKKYASASVRNSDSLEVKSFFPKELKDITGGADLRGVMATTRLMEIFFNPLNRVRVRDLLPVITTSNSSIDYIKETVFTNAAAAQVEGDAKMESSLTFEEDSVAIKTIAHWVPITRQLSLDIPALQNYIDTRLIAGLKIVEDAELLYGDGTGSHIKGIMNTTGIQTYYWSDGTANDTKIDAIRRAMTKVNVSQYDSTGIVLNPFDWEDIELAKDSQQRYIWAMVNMLGQKRLWAVPVVDTIAMTQGDFLTGAFDLAAAIWDREQANVRIADQHSDFFIKNMLAVLCEERLGLTVYRPVAFVRGHFDVAPSTS